MKPKINWSIETWGTLASLEYGKTLRNYGGAKGVIPVYGTNGPIGFTDKALCNFPSVIIGRKGAYRGIHYSSKPFFVIDTAFYLNPKTSEVNLKWAYYELLTKDINSMDSGSAIPSTSREDFYSLPVILPPLPEQRAIADILSSLDDKIELNNQMNKTLEQMARAIFKQWFIDYEFPCVRNDSTHQPSPPAPLPGGEGRAGEAKNPLPGGEGRAGEAKNPLPVGEGGPLAVGEGTTYKSSGGKMVDSELGMIPEGWAVGTLSDEFVITMGQSPPGSSYNEDGVGMPFFQGRADFDFRFPNNRMYCTEPKRLANKFYTLVSVRAPVGDMNIASTDCCIGRGLAAVIHKDGYHSYTYYKLLSLIDEFKNFESTGTVFGSINKNQFEGIKVKIPNSELVRKFDKVINDIDEKIYINTIESRTLSSIRDTLLPKLMSGELRVPPEKVREYENVDAPSNVPPSGDRGEKRGANA